MSSYEKMVKLACKPKAAPPKSKYLEPIIAATWSEEGAVGDVCKALSPRFREPNAVVVFKALLVLHNMIRNGATDNVLAYLSSSEVLRLKNVASENWEGYDAPQNLKAYATYLDTRIHAYRNLKHDAIRVQSESNRDMRSSAGFEEPPPQPKPSAKQPTRSKTIMGRKLRVMTVEKGLLRETRLVYSMIDALLQCRFYLDNLEDELITSALRMLVKDLLILFQAGNEGVINILEHYFEMSHIDAKEALGLYRQFCKQAEQVVEYLGIARKLQNLLNVSIPVLRHAPVSLAGSLQEYLDDPNFEQNRIEYKLNKDSAERNSKNGSKKSGKSSSVTTPPVPSPAPVPASRLAPNATEATQPVKKEVLDFFSAIEEEQTMVFGRQPNPNTNVNVNITLAQPQMTGAPNPFLQRQMFTGQPMMQPAATFPMSQNMGLAPNPFGFPPSQPLQTQPTGHRPFSTFLPNQPTGAAAGLFPSQSMQGGFLQPQATGSNPFRQSMVLPNSTGLPFSTTGASPFPNQNGPFSSPMNAPGSAGQISSFGGVNGNASKPPIDVPARPSSTPLTSIPSTISTGNSPPEAQPIKKHMTGSRNPFGPVVTADSTPTPPVPKVPTLFDLMSGANPGGGQPSPPVGVGLSSSPDQQTVKPELPGGGSFNFGSSALNPGKADISSVASSFTFEKPKETTPTPSTTLPSSPSSFPSLPDFSNFSLSSSAEPPSSSLSGSSLSSHSTGLTASTSPATVSSHATGFSGLKPFKPSSSFGAALMESLPPVSGSPTGTAGMGNNPSLSTPSSMTPPSQYSAGTTTSSSQPPNLSAQPMPFSSQPVTGLPTGSAAASTTLGVGLRPQMTGGAANPFRASMMNPSGTPPVPQNQGVPGSTNVTPFMAFNAGSAFGGMGSMPTGATPFGAGGAMPFQLNGQQPPRKEAASLI